VADGSASFIRSVKALLTDLDAHHGMREAARHYACGLSWDSVFESVFRAYRQCNKPNEAPESKAAESPERLTA
jgi:hypothetical protein